MKTAEELLTYSKGEEEEVESVGFCSEILAHIAVYDYLPYSK